MRGVLIMLLATARALRGPVTCTRRHAPRLAAAAVVIQAFYRGQVDRRLASSLAAYVLFFSVSTRLSPWP